LRDVEGCAVTTSATITEPPQLTVDAGEDRIINLGEQTLLEAISSEADVTYLWTPNENLTCEDCSSPLALPFFTTDYQVLVSNPDGCTASDRVLITVAKPRKLFIPTAFSPDNDGTNDFFTVYSDESATVIRALKVFDRWGNLVFDGRDLPPGEEALGWDGTFRGQRMNAGVYVYFAEVEFLDGISVIEKGDLLLAR
jgi:gliding motility-associated-like protein